ncbi:hypothetical protein D6783_05215 [Candidatus Woesearchaeota archaeon]|nr:MAG: hypothetical protein D6783_05215 [Candidatus Woesearchaeota archaeon]
MLVLPRTTKRTRAPSTQRKETMRTLSTTVRTIGKALYTAAAITAAAATAAPGTYAAGNTKTIFDALFGSRSEYTHTSRAQPPTERTKVTVTRCTNNNVDKSEYKLTQNYCIIFSNGHENTEHAQKRTAQTNGKANKNKSIDTLVGEHSPTPQGNNHQSRNLQKHQVSNPHYPLTPQQTNKNQQEETTPANQEPTQAAEHDYLKTLLQSPQDPFIALYEEKLVKRCQALKDEYDLNSRDWSWREDLVPKNTQTGREFHTALENHLQGLQKAVKECNTALDTFPDYVQGLVRESKARLKKREQENKDKFDSFLKKHVDIHLLENILVANKIFVAKDFTPDTVCISNGALNLPAVRTACENYQNTMKREQEREENNIKRNMDDFVNQEFPTCGTCLQEPLEKLYNKAREKEKTERANTTENKEKTEKTDTTENKH